MPQAAVEREKVAVEAATVEGIPHALEQPLRCRRGLSQELRELFNDWP